ncbi:MAG: CoA transferase [Flavobacteriales bacterium]
MEEVFKDLTVIDASSVLAGPSVGMFFAELGARVIKIENARLGGDVTRTWKTSSESASSTISAYWSSINYGKEYVLLDFSNPDDLSVLHNYISTADILLTNFKSGDDKKFGLENEALYRKYPKLIQAAITGFSSSPDRIAYDVVMQAETGFMYMNGTPETTPLKMPVALMDVLAAHQLKEAVLIALYQRMKTGKGGVYRCSLERAGLASLINQASNYLMNGSIPERKGSLHPNIAPYGEMALTSDEKWIVFAVGSDRQFHSLMQDLGLEDLTDSAAFKHNQDRVKNRSMLHQHIQEKLKLHTAEYWMQKFTKSLVPVGLVKSMQDIFETELAQSMVLTETIDGAITKRVTSIAFEDITPSL